MGTGTSKTRSLSPFWDGHLLVCCHQCARHPSHRCPVTAVRQFVPTGIVPQRKPPAIFPIFLQYCSPQRVAHFCILSLAAHARVVQGALLRETEETQASVGEPRGRASERGEEYVFRTELRKKMVRPERRETGCGDRPQTIQTVAARLGDLGEPNVPRGTLGGAKCPSQNGDRHLDDSEPVPILGWALNREGRSAVRHHSVI